jgi:3-oxoacyl-[acyl-carrier-protein] synthase-3
VEFGIRSFGSVLGESVEVADVAAEYTSDVERVLELGYQRMHRSSAGTGLVDLAVEAGTAAIKDSGVDPETLDLVVLAITDIPEYLYWDPAASLQARLGAHRAEALLIAQGCVGGITCLDSLAGRFATHPAYRRALVVGANRTCEAYWNRLDNHTLIFSDGAAAAIVERDHPRLRWRASEVISDGRYADFFLLEKGGAANPFRSGEDSVMARNSWDIIESFGYDPDRLEEFIDLTNNRVRQVVDQACLRIGESLSSLAKIILLNDNSRTLTALAGRLDIPVESTNVTVQVSCGPSVSRVLV